MKLAPLAHELPRHGDKGFVGRRSGRRLDVGLDFQSRRHIGGLFQLLLLGLQVDEQIGLLTGRQRNLLHFGKQLAREA